MRDWNPKDIEVTELYTLFWRFVEMVVHRYGSSPTGSLLTVLTISLLDQVDYHPTIGELAEITRLPKSTVSRYVSTEMSAGFLVEIIDPEDRRRRHLYTTKKTKSELAWLTEQLADIASMSSQVFRKNEGSHNPGLELKEILMSFSQKV